MSGKRIRFRATISDEARRPSVLAWVLVGVGLLVLAPFTMGLSLAVFVLLFLPAAIGSFLGWIFGGVRDEIRTEFR